MSDKHLNEKNPHTAQIEAYCRDWLETPEPWKRWAARREGAPTWKTCTGHPSWLAGWEYRRKPDTVMVNGFECIAPLKVAPLLGAMYWTVSADEGVICFKWTGDVEDRARLKNGLVCANYEDADALWNTMTAPMRAYVNGDKK